MWWGIFCVLVFHFCEQLAQLNEESEYDRIADFVDYDEESESSMQHEIRYHVRARRKDDTPGVLTPIMLLSNAIEDTTFRVTRSTKLDQNITTDIGTSVTKPDLDDLEKRKDELQNIDVKEDKDIDVKNMLTNFMADNRRKIEYFANHGAPTEAEINSTTIATIEVTTNSASGHRDQTNSEIDRESSKMYATTEITWQALNDSTTVKETFATRTNSDTPTLLEKDSKDIIEGSKNTLKAITWKVVTENTLKDYSVSQQDEYLVNDADYSSSAFTTQHDASTSETSSTQLQTINSQTSITTEIAIVSEEVSTQSTFLFPQDTIIMSITTKLTRKAAERQITTERENITTERPTINYEDKKIDVPKLLELLNYVVYDEAYRFNLTKKFNESLQKYNIPTCEDHVPSVPTTEPPTTINFNDAKVVAKCFVCGLDVERVPYSSACADAFAGDFIPLVPVDPKARGQIATFRKYCRYLDVNRVITTEDEPHSVFGRFTGGCAVRWVDLTSIYTQRVCRNRRRAVLGKHFASKRMAKLEMALSDVDNGCIISPVATLLPLSRGISLYARFHACVCTGTWCNKAIETRNWIMNNVMMFIVVTYVN